MRAFKFLFLAAVIVLSFSAVVLAASSLSPAGQVLSKSAADYFATWEELKAEHYPLKFVSERPPISTLSCEYGCLVDKDGKCCERLVKLVIVPVEEGFHVSMMEVYSDVPW